MIKWVRSITLIAALLCLGAGVVLLDASTEMDQAFRAYDHRDMDQAMRHARRAVFSSGENKKIAASALKLESTIAIKLGHPEKAMACLEQAILIHPACSPCYLQRGDLLYSQKNYPAAIHDFGKGLETAGPIKNKTKAYYYARQGLSLLAVGEDKKAQADSQKARLLDPTSPLAYFLESKVHAKIGDLEGAYNYAHTGYQLGQKKPGFFSSPEGDLWLRYYAGVRVELRKISKLMPKPLNTSWLFYRESILNDHTEEIMAVFSNRPFRFDKGFAPFATWRFNLSEVSHEHSDD